MSYEPSCLICYDIRCPNHCIIASLPRKRWIWPPQKQQYHSQRTRSRRTIHSKLQYVAVLTYSSKCNASSHRIAHKQCIFHTTIWFLWRLSLPHWMPINQQYLANSICNCCRLLTNAIAMAYPQAAATQSLSKQSHDNICLIIHPTPQPIKTQLATAARLINILKTPIAPRALPNMHLNHCILQLSLIDWMQGPHVSIFTPHI